MIANGGDLSTYSHVRPGVLSGATMPEGPTPKQLRIGARTCILAAAISGGLTLWAIRGDWTQAVIYAAGGVVLVRAFELRRLRRTPGRGPAR